MYFQNFIWTVVWIKLPLVEFCSAIVAFTNHIMVCYPDLCVIPEGRVQELSECKTQNKQDINMYWL